MWKNRKDDDGTRPNIYVRPDLTKAQLDADKQLRQQLQVMGKDQYMIFRGKIVHRVVSTSVPTSSVSTNTIDTAQPDQVIASLLPPPITSEWTRN